VLLANLGDRPVAIHRGDRVAQLVLVPVARATFVEATASTRPRAAPAASARPDGASARRDRR